MNDVYIYIYTHTSALKYTDMIACLKYTDIFICYMKNVNYISLIYIFHIHLDLISIIDIVLKLIHVSTFSIFNTAYNKKESSVHKTVASCNQHYLTIIFYFLKFIITLPNIIIYETEFIWLMILTCFIRFKYLKYISSKMLNKCVKYDTDFRIYIFYLLIL